MVPPSKIILGLPYYGYDWPTTDGTPTATATGPESPLSYATIAAAGHPTYWDPVTDTPWTSYQVGSQWYTTYFDDPTSMALKAQLANFFHIAGVGIWALGMDGNDPAMMAALLGNAPVTKDTLTGPPPGTGYQTVATFAGVPNVALDPIDPPPPGGTSQLVGFLGGIGTTDPALACLSTGPPVPVWSFTNMPGVYVVIAVTPTDCAAADWTFPIPAPTAPSVPALSGAPTTTTSRPVDIDHNIDCASGHDGADDDHNDHRRPRRPRRRRPDQGSGLGVAAHSSSRACRRRLVSSTHPGV